MFSRKNVLNALRIITQEMYKQNKIHIKFSQLVSINFSVHIFILSVFSLHWFETSQVVIQTHPNMEPVLTFQLCDGMLTILVTAPELFDKQSNKQTVIVQKLRLTPGPKFQA